VNSTRSHGWRRLLAAAGAAALLAGCEDVSTSNSIVVSPPAASFSNLANAAIIGVVTFVASTGETNQPLYMPLTWSVSTPSLGTIVGQAGNSAVYEGTEAFGLNVITVRDQGDREGVATVTHSPYIPPPESSAEAAPGAPAE
jgi:hypothetical protein